ncbi:MAG: ABC transporter ATP-binding protein, partial [Actinomycetota bacterium]
RRRGRRDGRRGRHRGRDARPRQAHPVSGDGQAGEPLLAAAGLTKRYRATVALDGAGIAVREGEAVALLGPNGSGKTTLLTILAGVSRPTSGATTWRPGGVARVGWVPHDPALYGRLTTRENLRLFAALEGAPDPDAAAADLLARADLAEYADRLAARLSTGTRQRLNLAIALAGEPSVLLLDEPTATLSPDQRHRLWAWLDELRTVDGLAVVFSTQSVDEAVAHGDRMVVLAGGRVVFDGDAARLVADHGTPGARDPAEAAFLAVVGADGR